MSLLSMLRTVGTLQRQTASKDASGGKTSTWAAASTAVTDVACDLQPASGDIQSRYMQRQLVVSHTAFLATDAGAKAGDRFVIGSRVFLVQGYEPPAPGYDEWPAKLHLQEIDPA